MKISISEILDKLSNSQRNEYYRLKSRYPEEQGIATRYAVCCLQYRLFPVPIIEKTTRLPKISRKTRLLTLKGNSPKKDTTLGIRELLIRSGYSSEITVASCYNYITWLDSNRLIERTNLRIKRTKLVIPHWDRIDAWLKENSDD